jgi:hypothetical protein
MRRGSRFLNNLLPGLSLGIVCLLLLLALLSFSSANRARQYFSSEATAQGVAPKNTLNNNNGHQPQSSQKNRQPTPAITPLPISTNTVSSVALLGIYGGWGDRQPFQAWVNRYPDFTGNWQGGGVAGGPYLDNIHNNYPVVPGFTPLDGDIKQSCIGKYADWNAAASGAYNSKWKGVIDTYMVPHASQIYLVRINSEWSGNWSCSGPWPNGAEKNPVVSPATWVAMMRQVIGVLKKELPNTKIEVDGPTDDIQLPYYPGDDIVDLIGHDFYWLPKYDGSDSHATWTAHLPDLNYLSSMAKAHNKPMYIGEWCDGYTDGYVLSQFAQWMAANNVAGQMYWDTNDVVPNSCRLTDYPARQQAYSDAFKGTQYNGTFFKHKALPADKAPY